MHPRPRTLCVALLALATAVSEGSDPSTATLPPPQVQPAPGTPAVAEANRGGVSFYAADAAGLRTKSGADEARRELTATADALHAASESESSLGARPGMTRLLERNEVTLGLDPSSGLGALAP